MNMQFKKLEWEQRAYSVIRDCMVEEFLTDPVSFIKRVGCRPEFMTPEQLRGMYRNILASGAEIKGEPGFIQRFKDGRMFA